MKTGIKKKKKSPKEEEVLKEDCQAFGLIFSKALSFEEAFAHPITRFPFRAATPDGNLRQSEKTSLRNYLIDQVNTSNLTLPGDVVWLIDGMTAVQTLLPKKEVWAVAGSPFKVYESS